MTSGAAGLEGAAPLSGSAPCPSLDPDVQWDDPSLLRGEIYVADHLSEHAAALARCHGVPSRKVRTGLLWRRFTRTRTSIREAYRVLTERLVSGDEPSPAEEWLLENSHVVEDQIREVEEDLPRGYLHKLPRLDGAAMRGYPHVYGLCLDYLRHTDARVDLATLSDYVRSYQTVRTLTIGELWAVPIMLRLGLLLTVEALAAAEVRGDGRKRGDAWANRLLEVEKQPVELGRRLLELENELKQPLRPAFLVQLLRRLREHEEPALGVVFDWIALQASRLGSTPEELVREQHLRQAGSQVSVGNAITSMRAVAALDWNRFFERTSAVEALLDADPAKIYALTHRSSRDRCRHAVESLARRSRADECAVAGAALELAREVHARSPADVRAHVGYYLIDDGRRALEQKVHYRRPLGEHLRRAVLDHSSLFYFGLIAFGSAAAWAIAAVALLAFTPLTPPLLLILALLTLPASEVGMTLANSLSMLLLEPRLLARLALEDGVPPELRTLVVVPTLLDSPQTLERLLQDLEVRSLANRDEGLHFGLLTDFPDAGSEELPEDGELLRAAIAGIQALNSRYPEQEQRYFLLHRPRLWNQSEGRYMGWERKRGKLEELNRLLRGARDTSFSVVTLPDELLRSTRYVITLDADTELPRDVAKRLVGTLAHPLNRAELDAKQRVVRGYGILQPRVGILPLSTRTSRYAAVSAGRPGIDPYTTAVSDVYQDLFGEGSFVGKGIYDVDTFAAALAGRVPENHLLSHDLFEGNYARSALLTDVEVLDEQPASYEIQVARQHRWIRGDWQLLPWLLPRVPGNDGWRASGLGAIEWWKIFDNLRRSLFAPALIAIAVVGWLCGHATGVFASAVLGVVLILPLVARFVLDLVRESSGFTRTFLGGLAGDVRTNLLQTVLALTFLLDQALVSLDAIARTLFRLLVTRRHLLEWTTTSQLARRWVRRGPRVRGRMWLGALLAAGLGGLIAWSVPDTFWYAFPALLAWCGAPLLSAWLSRPLPVPKSVDRVSPAEADFLRKTARKTWAFFERFVGEEDNFLPPDNFQQDPRGVVAHRTSPTNIGLYMLSSLAAHDFGFITLPEVCLRLEQTLGTLDKLPRREGHILNWYDTQTLRPLEPQYVSTVDSGNLAAYLWTLREACSELARSAAPAGRALLAVRDALDLAQLASRSAPKQAAPAVAELERIRDELDAAIRSTADDPRQALVYLGRLATAIGELPETPELRAASNDVFHWLERAESCARSWRQTSLAWAPHWGKLETVPKALLAAPIGPLWQEFLAAVDRARAPGLLLSTYPELETRLLSVDHELVKAEIDHTERIAAAGYVVEVRDLLRQSREASRALIDRLDRIAARCGALADGMNFRFLFDEARELFVTGYNVGNARLDPSYYDLLASEARLASLIAIAKGDAPQEHWFRLGRPRAQARSRYSLLSWSGSMFEYLMPLIVTKSPPNTLLFEACHSAVQRQREYARSKRVVWGISESAFNVMDLEMTYQYRAFGVPGLGLKPGLGEDLVIAPYATALAAMCDPARAVQNLRALTRLGMEGPYGYYESIDFSARRVPAGRNGVPVKTFMAHHHGMTLVSLDNVLHDHVMQERFHSDVRIKASELLLEERVPVRTPAVTVSVAATATPPAPGVAWDAMEHVALAANDPPRVHLLGHGALSTLVAATGSGALTWKGIDVNRFREDAVFDAGGIYVYIRNLSAKRLWSAGFHPTRQRPDSYEAAFSIDRVALHRRDGELETVTEIVPSAEHPAEVRRITLTNHGARPIDLDLTSYTELVLARRQADLAHRAFSSMFIETEWVPSHSALLAKRRRRSAGEDEVWVVQVFTPEDGAFGELDYDTSRAEFIGRAGSITEPAGLEPGARLARRTGAVLDPAFVLQRTARLEPGQQMRIALTTALASSREEALHLAEIYGAPQGIPRAFELGWADARVELRHLGISAAQAHRFQRLLSAIVFPQVALRAGLDPATVQGHGREALWARGLSGDLPILLLRLDQPEFTDLCRELLLAHEYWRVNGISVDFVVLNEEPSGYMQPQQEAALDLIRSNHAEAQIDQAGGVFLRRADQITPSDRALLLAAARVVLTASGGSLARQLGRAAAARRRGVDQRVRRVRPAESALALAPAGSRPQLEFDNGFGGFRKDGSEYVMVLGDGVKTPAPWCNVIANQRFGTLVTERGASFTWFENSQRHRLTPWSNDAIGDPSGELVYVRDDEDGSVWTPTPEPASRGAEYVVSHGQGYTRFEHVRSELEHELTLFVSPTDPVKYLRLRIKNAGKRVRRLSVFGVIEWVLGTTREAMRLSVVTNWDPKAGVLYAQNPFSIFPEGAAFLGATREVQAFTASRDDFFGLSATRALPAALERGELSRRVGAGLDPCGALEVHVQVAPGETEEVTFVLGHGENLEDARALVAANRDAASVERSFDAALASWRELLGTISVKTPDPSFDLLVNHWLLYQVTSCRLWARSGFYQSSGAYGFRDQVQDVLALLHTRPALAREHLLRAAARQFVEGDVQHWWHPQTGDGIRSTCSDDMLWLPFATTEYVAITGDRAILDEPVPFLSERLLKPEEEDLYSTPPNAPEAASLYEHCVRALDVGTTAGVHGIPLMRGGDWNDGMNRVGREGTGESTWLGWFLIRTLRSFAKLALARGDTTRVMRCEENAARITRAIEAHAWDGTWYRRAYFDDGTPLGTQTADECRIDAIAQSWAVLAETGDRSRATLALRESEALLIREQARLMALLWPPFEHSEPDPGYIRAYPAGIRENGGQYTHGVLFTLQALARLGESERAFRLLSVLNPVNHALTPEDARHYVVEPYVVAADVYAAKNHMGRGGWTWYTGSAGWMYRIMVEELLGLKRDGDRLFIAPCVPQSWTRFEVRYRFGTSLLDILVENPEGIGHSVERVEVGGRIAADHSIQLIDDGRHRHVRVRLGAARLRSSA
jgi:cyclic beta-1,2-glucan synthetase